MTSPLVHPLETRPSQFPVAAYQPGESVSLMLRSSESYPCCTLPMHSPTHTYTHTHTDPHPHCAFIVMCFYCSQCSLVPTAVEKSPAYINVTQIYSCTRPHHRADTSQGVLRARGGLRGSRAGSQGRTLCAVHYVRGHSERLSVAHANVDFPLMHCPPLLDPIVCKYFK